MGKKDGGSQTVTTVPDQATQDYVRQMRQLALGYAGLPGTTGGNPVAQQGAQYLQNRGGIWGNIGDQLAAQHAGTPTGPSGMPPLPPGIQQAIGQYGQYAQAGQQGLAALAGDAGAQAQFMSPYQHNLDPYWALARQQAVGAANDQATLEGAFGGGRNDVTQGVALSGIANAQGAQQYQAFLDAMQRAQGAAGLGLGAIGAGAFLPQQYQSGQLGLLQQALGPYGQTQTQPMYQNRGAGIIGGAIAGAPLGPLGILGGGIIGGLG